MLHKQTSKSKGLIVVSRPRAGWKQKGRLKELAFPPVNISRAL